MEGSGNTPCVPSVWLPFPGCVADSLTLFDSFLCLLLCSLYLHSSPSVYPSVHLSVCIQLSLCNTASDQNLHTPTLDLVSLVLDDHQEFDPHTVFDVSHQQHHYSLSVMAGSKRRLTLCWLLGNYPSHQYGRWTTIPARNETKMKRDHGMKIAYLYCWRTVWRQRCHCC